ncbi:MAG: glycosyltransferase family 4 protein [Ruminococcus sp.]|nr:glycosyltransferase family 4 protein [Ruminococcus sp.]MDD5889892.1 glycosyltransferase family 4 protein [Ruminococcus sp.]MDD6709697.1 glycosyltransferase family 4 protein [Ruminococcus sp.]
MNITFTLPQPGNNPIGGYKIIYEYANRFSDLGHKVTIVYDCNRLFYKDKLKAERLLKIHIKYNRKKHWFLLNNNIKIKYALDGIQNKYFPSADFVIVSDIDSVMPVYNLDNSKGKMIYFIQDIENWRHDDEFVNSTYALPVTKIAISSWIKNRVDKYSDSPAILIPNGIDFSKLGIEKSIEERNPYTVSMLYHALEHKGSKYGIEALMKLKKSIPELKVEMFGVPDRPTDLPDWVHYTQRATAEQLKKIYNSTSLFLCPTINEGFGLTGAESMACGCALVSTDYDGIKEYAVNQKNSLLCPSKDSDALCNAMLSLINDNERRIAIAKEGSKDIEKLNWDRAVKDFIGTLSSI